MSSVFKYKPDDLVNEYHGFIYVVEIYDVTARAFILTRHKKIIQTRCLGSPFIAERWSQDFIDVIQHRNKSTMIQSLY